MQNIMLIRSKNLGRNFQNGAVAIIVALSLPVLIGMAGLALDLGKLYITKTELQNASDACALAAAVELDGTVTQFTNAVSAGNAVGQLNKSYFQSTAVSFTTDEAIKFSKQLNGTYLTKTAAMGSGTPASYQFVQCNASHLKIHNYLVPVLNILGSNVATTSNVAATAVATNRPGQATCALPIGICSTQLSSTTPIGTWLQGIQTAQGAKAADGSFTGYFKWVDFTGGGGGTNELKNVLSGSNACNVNTSDPNVTVAEFGGKNGAEFAYNTRFGLYTQSVTGVPDTSGYAYNKTSFAAAFNAYPDFIANKRSINAQYQGDVKTKLNTKPGLKTTLTAAELASLGNKSRRVGIAPVIDCTTKKIQRYVCMFLLHPMNTGQVGKNDDGKMYLEYLGNADNSGPCKQSGLAGSSNGIGPKISALVQ